MDWLWSATGPQARQQGCHAGKKIQTNYQPAGCGEEARTAELARLEEKSDWFQDEIAISSLYDSPAVVLVVLLPTTTSPFSGHTWAN